MKNVRIFLTEVRT